MIQKDLISSFLVRSYDEAIQFYEKFGFVVAEDIPISDDPPANVSESRGDSVADPKWHERRPRRPPPPNRCRMGIVSTVRQHPMKSNVGWMNTDEELSN